MVFTYTFFNTTDHKFDCAERSSALTIPQRTTYAAKGLTNPVFSGTAGCAAKGYPKRVWGGGIVAAGLKVFSK